MTSHSYADTEAKFFLQIITVSANAYHVNLFQREANFQRNWIRGFEHRPNSLFIVSHQRS